MEKMPLISVIVPVYRVEKYLHKCIDSILKQSYTNIEVILIDDGSPDKCGIICDKYSEQDSRIKVIHKVNGGLSDARNAGLDIMSGELVTCIDSDDFVSEYYIENLFKAMSVGKTDIAASWFTEYHEGDAIQEAGVVNSNHIEVLTQKKYYERMLYQERAEVSAWGKLYKRALFDGIRYPKGKVYEDMAIIYKLIDQVQAVAVIPTVDYYYLQRETSIAQETFSLRKMDAVKHAQDLMFYIDKSFPELHKAAECRYFNVLCNIVLMMEVGMYKKEQDYVWQEIKNHRKSVMLNPAARMKSRCAALLSYGGFTTLKLIYQLFKMKRAREN